MSNVVFICIPIANYAAASCLIHRGLPTHHTIWWWRVDLYHIPPASPHQTTSLTTATVPCRSIANRHVKRRLHMYANRKLRSSKLFDPLGPSYTPYHMVVESRPLYLLLCLH